MPSRSCVLSRLRCAGYKHCTLLLSIQCMFGCSATMEFAQKVSRLQNTMGSGPWVLRERCSAMTSLVECHDIFG